MSKVRFELEGRGYCELADAAQDAEFGHAKDGRVRRVTAAADCERGMFRKGDCVYESQGGPD